jgi:hypothetical protein
MTSIDKAQSYNAYKDVSPVKNSVPKDTIQNNKVDKQAEVKNDNPIKDKFTQIASSKVAKVAIAGLIVTPMLPILGPSIAFGALAGAAVKKFLDSKPPTEKELKWAVELQNKVIKGEQPTKEEIKKYENIYNKQQKHLEKDSIKTESKPSQTIQNELKNVNWSKATESEIEWAVELENKVSKEKYKPNSQEQEVYNSIKKKLSIN